MKDNKNIKLIIIFGGSLILLIVLILVIILFNENNKEVNNNYSSNSAVINDNINLKNSEEANVIPEELIKSLEKTEDGIQVSNVKLNFNNNTMRISMHVKNYNKEPKNVNIDIKYFSEDNNEIGENNFLISNIKPDESKYIENTGYIKNKNIKYAEMKLVLDNAN